MLWIAPSAQFRANSSLKALKGRRLHGDTLCFEYVCL